MQIYFLQPVLIIFTKGAINSEHDCMKLSPLACIYMIWLICSSFWAQVCLFCEDFSLVDSQS